MEQPKATYRPAGQGFDTDASQKRTDGTIKRGGGYVTKLDQVQIDFVIRLMALVDTYADTACANGIRSGWAQIARSSVENALIYAAKQATIADK